MARLCHAQALHGVSCDCPGSRLHGALGPPLPLDRRIILDPGARADKEQQRALLARIKAAAFDASICLFSQHPQCQAGVEGAYSLPAGPAAKLAQVLYNQRLVQRRSRSQKPGTNTTWIWCAASSPIGIRPWWSHRDPTASTRGLLQVREQVAARLRLDASRPWLMVHAGSGSANNLSIEQYSRLIISSTRPVPSCSAC